MKWIGLILLVVIFIFSCEKQDDDLLITQKKVTENEFHDGIYVSMDEKPYYYKDSLREAFLLRAKKVISKYAGFTLIDVSLIKEDSVSTYQKPSIVNVRNVKDSLFVVIKFVSKNDSRMLYGIEIPNENTINFLSKTYSVIKNDSPHCYWVRYCVLKRKFSRLAFLFEGEPIVFHKNL